MAQLRRLLLASALLALFLAILYPAAARADAGASAHLEPALLSITLNGRTTPQPALALQDGDGAFYFNAEMIQQWRLRTPGVETIEYDGVLYFKLSAARGIHIEFNSARQELSIDADPGAFMLQRTEFGGTGAEVEMSARGTGAYIDYDMIVEASDGDLRFGGSFQATVYTPAGVGTTSFVARLDEKGAQLTRLETSWTIDRPEHMTSLRIGDTTTAGGLGAPPVRFAGLRYARNFAVQPGFITMPLPTLAGSATLPSTVDIYVDDALQTRSDVEPGPFELHNIPVRSGGGTVQLVVRDLLGRETVQSVQYYASSTQLRRGLHDFSYSAGFLRKEFGAKSNQYGEFVAATTHRYGLSDSFTLEGQAQASKSVQMAGIGVIYSNFDLGLIGVSVATSRTSDGWGARVTASYERSRGRLSFGARAEYATPRFSYIGHDDGKKVPQLVAQAYVDYRIGSGSSIGANLAFRSQRGRPDETVASAVASFRIGNRASVQLFARHVMVGRSETIVGVNLGMSFGGNASVSGGIQHDASGVRGYASFQRSPPIAHGGGYRIAVGAGKTTSIEAGYRHNLGMASLGAEVSHIGGQTGIRLSAAGSIGLAEGHLFASRQVGQSFATVQVSGYEGVRVYLDNQLIGETNDKGRLLVPFLRPYEANRVRIDPVDLPLDVQFDATSRIVRPYAGSGVGITFEAHQERGVLVHLVDEGGGDLPIGAWVRIDGDAAEHPVAHGEVYLPTAEGTVFLSADWTEGRCRAEVEVPDNDDPQPRIGPVVCRSERYALD